MRKLLIGFILGSIYSCATVFSGQKQWVPLISDVPGATVEIDHEAVDTTPCIVKLKRKRQAPLIILKHPNYEPQRVELETKWNETTALNNIILPFWAIDFAAGTWIKYKPLDTIILQKPSN